MEVRLPHKPKEENGGPLAAQAKLVKIKVRLPLKLRTENGGPLAPQSQMVKREVLELEINSKGNNFKLILLNFSF